MTTLQKNKMHINEAMAMNRKSRRKLGKEVGVKIPGSRQPIIGSDRKK